MLDHLRCAVDALHLGLESAGVVFDNLLRIAEYTACPMWSSEY